MKNVLILLVSITVLIFSSCSENYEKVYYPNGTLKAMYETNNNGEFHGFFKGLHENGEIFVKANFKNGDYHGLVKTFYDNGQLKSKGNYISGEKHNIHKEYHKNGNLKLKSSYLIGKLNGPLIKYDEQEMVIEYEFYKEGIFYSEYVFIDSLKSEYLNSLDKLIVSPRFDTLHLQDSIKVTIDIILTSNMTYNYEVRTICADITAEELKTYKVEKKNNQIEYWFKPTEPGNCHFNVLALPAGRNGWDYHLLGIGEYHAIENKDDLPQ